MALGRHVRFMRGLVVDHQAERLVRGAVFEPVQRDVGDDIGQITLVQDAALVSTFAPGLSGFFEGTIQVAAVAGQHAVEIKPGRLGEEMPFADDGGLIAGTLEKFREGWLRTIKMLVEFADAAEVVVLAGQQRGTRGGTE